MLILSRGCRKLDEACAGRCEGKGWRHDCQRANYNVFFWGALFSTALLCFLFSSSNAAWLFDVPFLFLSPFFFYQAWIRGKRKYTNERTDNEWNAIPTALQNKQIQPVFFFFFAILFCLCILFFSSVASPLVCSLSLFFFFQFSIFQYSHSLALLHCVCVIARTRSDY